ncbi:hypothetical protein [Limnohabitans sp. Rim8]|uniref:hypothetical protein n=1 Tax=Limnohabitans sp. Rim8 TaxID=1100718 RepID=UPI0026150A87|nr:hypothetical protein [Limnohabitans sp. Rim8]
MQIHFHSVTGARALRCIGMTFVLAFSLNAAAQSINSRWVGVWYSDTKQRLEVSEQQFNPGSEKCKWVGARPAKSSVCVAFYEGLISVAQLTSQLQQAEKAALDMAQRKSLPAADLQSIKDDFKRNRQVMQGMPNIAFRVVKTLAADDQKGATDCSDYFFIDQKELYYVMSCDAAPDAFSIKVYKKG